MKICHFYLGFIFFLILYGCKKNNDIPASQVAQLSIFDSAVTYLKSQLSSNDFSKLNLAQTKILRYHGKNIGIQIFEKNESTKKYLVLKRVSNDFLGNWVDMTDLKSSKEATQNGTVTLENINIDKKVYFEVKNNKVVNVTETGKNVSQRNLIHSKDSSANNNLYSRMEESAVELPEIVVLWSGPEDFTSLYWLFDQDSNFEDSYVQGGGGGTETSGGIAGNGTYQDNVIDAPTFVPPASPITDLKREIECFGNNNLSTYSISVNVNEPWPGTRGVFDPFSSFKAGHTFFTLQQQNADGSSIVRNLGFYPKYGAIPGDPLDVGIFGDDSNTPFTVSLKITVSGSDLMKVIQNLENQPLVFDLNNFNCTNSAIDALKSININLPSTKSSSALFSGNTPGELGEDIRSMNLNNFSANNGSRAVTRTVSDSDNQSTPPRSGGC